MATLFQHVVAFMHREGWLSNEQNAPNDGGENQVIVSLPSEVQRQIWEELGKGIPGVHRFRLMTHQKIHPVTGRTVVRVERVKEWRFGHAGPLLSRKSRVGWRRFRCDRCHRTDLPKPVGAPSGVLSENKDRVGAWFFAEENFCVFCARMAAERRNGASPDQAYSAAIRGLLMECRYWNWPRPFPVVFLPNRSRRN